VTPSPVYLVPDSTVQLTATVRDGAGNTLGLPVSWSSFAPAVATVSSAGLVTGLSDGLTRIGAAAQSVSTTVTVEVFEPLGFQIPMDGELGQDFYLVNYLDQAGPGDITDYNCGPKSYDGHQGIDIALRSFAQMDSLVAIIAPAPGRVVATRDGLFDRNKNWNNGGGFANYVALQHSNGYISFYGHMKKESVAVSEGDQVEVGDTLGFVGSSGTSDIPHLHFEVRRGDETVDPFAGECSTPITHWAEQIGYRDQFGLADADVTLSEMDLDLAKDRAPVADTIVAGAAGTLTAWTEYVNVQEGDVTRFRILRPDGSEARFYQFTHSRFYSLSWWWAWWQLGSWLDEPGEWTMEVVHEGTTLASRPFQVVEGAEGVWSVTGSGSPAGAGGGGLERPERGSGY
jgi:murein DD-endopeptidase MepM/ murein hydrolase activator NlpD